MDAQGERKRGGGRPGGKRARAGGGRRHSARGGSAPNPGPRASRGAPASATAPDGHWKSGVQAQPSLAAFDGRTPAASRAATKSSVPLMLQRCVFVDRLLNLGLILDARLPGARFGKPGTRGGRPAQLGQNSATRAHEQRSTSLCKGAEAHREGRVRVQGTLEQTCGANPASRASPFAPPTPLHQGTL